MHADKLRQRNVPRGYIDNIETTVKELRKENQVLRRRLAALQAAGAKSSMAVPIPNPASIVALEYLNSMEEHGNAAESIRSFETRPSVSFYQQSWTKSNSTEMCGSFEGSYPECTLAQEARYLCLAAAGETRYLGSSSAMGLATLLSTLVDVQDSMSPQSSNEKMLDSCRIRPIHSLPVDFTLPSRVVATRLIESYFQHTHLAFPLLHRPSFMAIVEKIYTEPTYYNANIFEAFTFDMVLAIGGSNPHQFEASSAETLRFYGMAKAKFRSVIDMDRYTALKAILMVSEHDISSNLQNATTTLWHLIGIGGRICVELGLHVSQAQVEEPFFGQVTTMEQEMRRRCFWCLYNLDR